MNPVLRAFGGAPYLGYETLCWACRKGHAVGGEPHMNPVPGAFGGAPYGATKRCAGRAEEGHAVGGETL